MTTLKLNNNIEKSSSSFQENDDFNAIENKKRK
jgi:hypothetical protein